MDKNITVATMQYKDDVKVSTEEYLRTYYTFNIGDIAFEGHQSKDFRFGRFVENDIGNGIVSHIFPVFRPIVAYDLFFWKYAINNENLMQIILSRSTKASTMMHDLVTNDFLQESFCIPCLDEQRKIGSYLNGLDNLIALHQRKCFSLKILCRYEIFITWEQRKLGEIADHVIEKNLSLVEHETFTNSAEFGIVSQMDFFDHGITNEENIGNYYIVHPEDFVYNPRISVTAPVGPINRNKLGRNGVMSPLYTVFRPHDIDNTYLEYYFKADGWHSFMRFNGDTGARSDRFSIKTELFYEMPILIPKLEEQNAIGRFLRNLSEHIALHQRKANPLKILVYRSDFFDSF